jgi:hypothetical protein
MEILDDRGLLGIGSPGVSPQPVVASRSMSFPRRVVPYLATLFIVLVVAGCSFVETVPPSPTPADFQGTAAELAKRGIRIDRVVSGDPGCPDKVLAPTARSFDASGLDQATTVRIYLYMFADRATYERLRTTVDDCARSYVTDPETYQSVEQSPFVLAGQGPWGTAFESALRAGLVVAAGSGDNARSDYP